MKKVLLIVVLCGLLVSSLILHEKALAIMQSALFMEWSLPVRYIGLFRVLRLAAPIIIGLWVLLLYNISGWRRILVLSLMMVGGLLAVLSLQ